MRVGKAIKRKKMERSQEIVIKMKQKSLRAITLHGAIEKSPRILLQY